MTGMFPRSDRRVYTSREASHLTGVPQRSITGWARRGDVPSGRRGRRLMFSFADLVEIMLRRRLGRAAAEHPRYKGEWARLAGELFRGGAAAAELGLEHISVDPEVLSGEPAIVGTRIHVMFAGALADNGETGTLLNNYGLNAEQAEDARRWKLLAETYPRGRG